MLTSCNTYFFVLYLQRLKAVTKVINRTTVKFFYKMKRDLFRRYVWLIDTIRHAKKIQFEEITERWTESPINADHSQLALRTFHNHRHAIENLFGIRIICNRTDRNRYSIAEWPDANTTKLKMWMLHKLSFSDLDEEIARINDRILLDITPEEKYNLPEIIMAIQNNSVIKLDCAIPTSDNKTSLLFAPYCIRFWNSQWFVLGKDIQTGMLHAFNLERVIDITHTDSKFEYPADFKPDLFFRDYYGMDIKTDKTPETVRLKICGRTRDKVRTRPLHDSQKEVMTNNDFSVFEYFLVPSDGFQNTILSHGTDSEVLSPLSLRESVAGKLNILVMRYGNDARQAADASGN